MTNLNYFQNKLKERITNRWHVTNISDEEKQTIEQKVIATYDEALENGINDKESYKLALSDLDKLAPLDYTIKPRDGKKYKIYFILLITLFLGLQLLFINLENLNYRGNLNQTLMVLPIFYLTIIIYIYYLFLLMVSLLRGTNSLL